MIARFLTSTISLGLLIGIIHLATDLHLNPEQALETGNDDTMISQEVRAIIPTSERLMQKAVDVLSKGWEGMSQAEREAFLALYDPADTGDVNQAFIEAVLANYQKILGSMNKEITVVYEPDNEKCVGMRLYYTDLLKLHVCPYFLREDDEVRKARTLIHEIGHNALLAVDRPYYRPTNKAYAQLTPNGSWLAQLPVVGPLVREIQHSDTLYHPDAYAHFTIAVSGHPVNADMYTDQQLAVNTAGEMVSQPAATNLQVVDNWALGS